MSSSHSTFFFGLTVSDLYFSLRLNVCVCGQDRKQLDLQLRFYNPDYTRKHRDVIESSPMPKVRRKPGPPTKPSSNYSSGVGNTLRFLRQEPGAGMETCHKVITSIKQNEVVFVKSMRSKVLLFVTNYRFLCLARFRYLRLHKNDTLNFWLLSVNIKISKVV